MEITLITTTRDRAQLLLNCARSIYAQSCPPHEWLVYIDDSYNSYREVIKEIVKLVPYVNVISQDRKIGRVAALEYAHAQVKTQYVGWVDDDDWLHRDCLKICNTYPESSFIYTDFWEVRANSMMIGERNKIPFSHRALLEDNIVFHFRLFTQSLFDTWGGLDLSFDTTMDYELTLRLLAQTVPTKVDIPLYYYRIHKRRISARSKERQQVNFMRALSKNSKLYDKYLPR